jgi:basic amino acid/polyamine antiporter, APA family
MQPQLARIIGPWTATAVLVGCVIGTGVFKKASAVAGVLPESGVALSVWLVVGLLTLCGALALAEVAALFPTSGGNLVFLQKAYGRLFGFLWAWVEFWFLRCASIAALSVIFSESLNDVLRLLFRQEADVLGFWPRQVASGLLVFGLGVLAARGTQLGARFQLIVTTVKVGAIVLIALLPVLALLMPLGGDTLPSAAQFDPLWPSDWSTLNLAAYATAMVAVMWPYNGWTNVAPLAGEIKDPQRNVPRVFIGGLLLLTVLYVSVNISYYFAVPGIEMKDIKGSPVSTEVCRRLIGPAGLLLASAALMLSVFGSVGGNLLVGPRSVFAMANEKMAPAYFGQIHARYQTPMRATFVMMMTTIAMIFGVALYTGADGSALKSSFDLLTDFVVFGATLLETLAVATIYVFRVTHRDAPRPYRCPGYPVVPALYILVMLLVLVNMLMTAESRTTALTGLGFIAAGVVIYVLFVRRR